MAEKVIEFLYNAEKKKTTFSSFEFDLSDKMFAIARYEYYKTFPYLLSEEKESVIAPEKGVNRYCRSVFGNKSKDDWCLDLCSEKAESFPFIIRPTSVSVSTGDIEGTEEQSIKNTEERSILLQPTKLKRETLFEVLVLVLIVAVLIFIIIIIIRFCKSRVSKRNRRRRFAKRKKLETV